MAICVFVGWRPIPWNCIEPKLPLMFVQTIFAGSSRRYMPPSSASSRRPLASNAAAWWSGCGDVDVPAFIANHAEPLVAVLRMLFVPAAPEAYAFAELVWSTASHWSYQ